MLRTIFTIGLIAFVGMFALKIAFGLFGVVFGILFGLLRLAIPILVMGAIIYFVVRVFSPDTAKGWKDRWSGPAS
ncbi:MAG: hypothetical protein K2X99_07310 [Gemmatimonadaceae bacterium]|nr:hypothetical protein [Gemmatimonadaceae bacterium]